MIASLDQSASGGDAAAFESLRDEALRLVENGEPIPPLLAPFVRHALETAKPPTKRGKPPNPEHDFQIHQYVQLQIEDDCTKPEAVENAMEHFSLEKDAIYRALKRHAKRPITLA